MHAGEHSILERLAGDIVERWQDEKVNRRNCLASDKALQDRHHSGAIKAAPIERLARKPKRRLDVVERDPVIRRRSIGRGLADEFRHARFGPPIIRDFKLGRQAGKQKSHGRTLAETNHICAQGHLDAAARATTPVAPCSRARSRRSLRRGSVGLVRPPEGDGLADVLAGSECIQDEAADVGSRNRRKDGASAAPCDLAAGCLQPSSSGSDGRWCSRGRSHGPLALARPCRRVPLGGAGRRARARVIRRRLGCPRHRTSSGRSGGERLRPSGPQSGSACLEKRRWWAFGQRRRRRPASTQRHPGLGRQRRGSADRRRRPGPPQGPVQAAVRRDCVRRRKRHAQQRQCLRYEFPPLRAGGADDEDFHDPKFIPPQKSPQIPCLRTGLARWRVLRVNRAMRLWLHMGKSRL